MTGAIPGDPLRVLAGSVELDGDLEPEQAQRTGVVLRTHAMLLGDPRAEVVQAVPLNLAELAAQWTEQGHPLGRIYGKAAEIAAQVVLDLALEPAESTRPTQPCKVFAEAGQA